MSEFRLWEINRKCHDDCIVSETDDFGQAIHYAMMYLQDGDVRLESKISSNWLEIDLEDFKAKMAYIQAVYPS